MARRGTSSKPLARCPYCGHPVLDKRAKSHTACRLSVEVRDEHARPGSEEKMQPYR